MKLKEMIPGRRYKVVTNGSTLKKGDRIYLDPKNRSLICDTTGWLEPDEWKYLRNKVEPDIRYYEKMHDCGFQS